MTLIIKFFLKRFKKPENILLIFPWSNKSSKVGVFEFHNIFGTTVSTSLIPTVRWGKSIQWDLLLALSCLFSYALTSSYDVLAPLLSSSYSLSWFALQGVQRAVIGVLGSRPQPLVQSVLLTVTWFSLRTMRWAHAVNSTHAMELLVFTP